MLRTLILLLSVVFSLPTLRAQCEPQDAVRRIVEVISRREIAPSKLDRDAARKKLLDDALAEYPDDFYLLQARMLVEDTADAQIRWAQRLYSSGQSRVDYAVVYAESLFGTDTPQAIRILQALKAHHPESPQVHLSLANIAAYPGRYADEARVQEELQAFVKLCPASLDTGALKAVQKYLRTEQVARIAAAVRMRLESLNTSSIAAWEALWSMEFKSRPVSEHAALCKQIARDLAHVETAAHPRVDLAYLTFLERGYAMAGHPETAETIRNDILRRYPASSYTEHATQQQWDEKHPRPADKDGTQMEAFTRERLRALEGWRRQWPGDVMLSIERFNALATLKDTKPEQIAAEADSLMSAYQRSNLTLTPPLEYRVAEVLIDRGIGLDRVPSLLEDGNRRTVGSYERSLNDDRLHETVRSLFQDAILAARLERARILLKYCAAVKQPEKAYDVEADLASLEPTKPGAKSSLLARRAEAAELQGRRQDALALYRAAAETRGRMPALEQRDHLQSNLDRLTKQLRGAQSSSRSVPAEAKARGATESSWEHPKNALPDFSLTDIEGKSWTLTALRGKAVLINVWASWCGPCRQEHSEFQALYERLRNRKDVAVLSFNVDDNPGVIQPYMRQNHYTFPAIPASQVVSAVAPQLILPRNWFVDRGGRLLWEHIGFGNDPKWKEMMIGKLEELLKGDR